MTSAASPAPSVPSIPSESAPSVQGETLHDRVTSLLMSFIVGVGFIVGLLWLMYLTNQAYANQVMAPLEIIEVVGGPGGGGSPEGEAGETGNAMDVPGGAPADFASNADGDAPDFEEPSLQQVTTAALDMSAPMTDNDGMAEMDLGAATASGGMVASGRRASRVGTGRMGLGRGGSGDGGVRREQRWSVVYNPGQTLDEYARQLDFFGVEIGIIKNNAMQYVSSFGKTPKTRFGQHASDNRLFFVWQSNTRKNSDVELLRRAGVEVGDSPIFHFYPEAVENQLAQLEARFRGRQPIEIKATRFSVVSRGNTYGLAVLTQEPLTR